MPRPPRPGPLQRYGFGLFVAALGTVAALIALAVPSISRVQLGRAYVLGMTALALYYLVRELVAPDLLPEPRGAVEPQPEAIPAELAQIQDRLRAGRASRAEFDRDLRPLLREVARDRLQAVGVDLDLDSEQARSRLGPQASMAVLDQGPSRWDAAGRGPRQRELEALLDTLEGIGR